MRSVAQAVGRRTLRAGFAAAIVAVPALGLASCAQVPAMRGEIEALAKVTDQAERNGALRCAPRELAMAKAHLAFARTELDQASFLRAKEHLEIAQSNANAAYEMTPAQKCSERGFIEEPQPGDKDGDGYPDTTDKCPEQPENWQGYQDEDGCPDDPDTDGDGVADSRDQCVMTPEDLDKYLDDDGCPDVDNDADTVLDVADKDASGKSCANDPEDPDGFEDADGCPDLDNDNDKTADLLDQCPNEPGPPNAEKPGCPKKSLVIVTDKEIKITQQIHFEFDKDKIRPESFPILDAVAEVLKQNPKIRIEVQGHTDNKGAPAYNKSLSDRRAAAVKKFLVARGISPDRLTSKGYGMEVPIVPNNTDQNRALNRRVQFVRTEGQ